MKHLLLFILLFVSVLGIGQRDTIYTNIVWEPETHGINTDYEGDSILVFYYTQDGATFNETYTFVKDVDTMQYWLDSLVFSLAEEVTEAEQRMEYIYNLFKLENSNRINRRKRWEAFRALYYDKYGYYPPNEIYEP